jgi:hypothetical protein
LLLLVWVLVLVSLTALFFPIAFVFVICSTFGLGNDALCFLGAVASSGKKDVLASATAFAAAKASAPAFLFSAWVVWGR